MTNKGEGNNNDQILKDFEICFEFIYLLIMVSNVVKIFFYGNGKNA